MGLERQVVWTFFSHRAWVMLLWWAFSQTAMMAWLLPESWTQHPQIIPTSVLPNQGELF